MITKDTHSSDRCTRARGTMRRKDGSHARACTLAVSDAGRKGMRCCRVHLGSTILGCFAVAWLFFILCPLAPHTILNAHLTREGGHAFASDYARTFFQPEEWEAADANAPSIHSSRNPNVCGILGPLCATHNSTFFTFQPPRPQKCGLWEG